MLTRIIISSDVDGADTLLKEWSVSRIQKL